MLGEFVRVSISVDAENDESSVARDRQIGIRGGGFLNDVVDPRIRLVSAVHP
jgi:hypothetical protein